MSSSPCAACKFLRRKCTPECVFAPYFPADQPKRFSDVHKVFGASNVSKILNELDASHREDAVQSLAYEADARIKDPVYGCVGQISNMQQTLTGLRLHLENSKRELASLVGPEIMGQMLQDPVVRAKFNPHGNPGMPNFASSSNPNIMAMNPGQQFKLIEEQQRLEQLRQEKILQHQRQQIGAHIMQQMIQRSQRHHQLKQQQQQLLEQQQGGQKQLLLDRQQQVREQQNGGQLVIRDEAQLQQQQAQAQALAALQAREEQEMYKTYEEMHREAQMYVLQQQREAHLMRLHEEQQREAQLMRFHQEQQQREAQLRRLHEEQQLRAQMEGGQPSGSAELSPLLALGNGFGAMNPYQQQEQPLLNPYHYQQQEQQPILMLQQPQQHQEPQEIINIPDDHHQQHPEQQQQQEIQDIQLFPDHSLLPPEPENGG